MLRSPIEAISVASSLVSCLLLIAGCHNEEPPAGALQPGTVTAASNTDGRVDEMSRPAHYVVTIQRFEAPHQNTKRPNVWSIRFQVDQPLPVDYGYLIATIKGVPFEKANLLDVVAIPNEDDGDAPHDGEPQTDRFSLTVDLEVLRRYGIGLSDILDLASISRDGGAPAAALPKDGAPSGEGRKTGSDKQVGIHLAHHAPAK